VQFVLQDFGWGRHPPTYFVGGSMAHGNSLSSPSRAAERVFGVVVRPLQAFLRLEAASGVLLLVAAAAALAWANLDPRSYRATFDYPD
jgi:hypothetical protein